MKLKSSKHANFVSIIMGEKSNKFRYKLVRLNSYNKIIRRTWKVISHNIYFGFHKSGAMFENIKTLGELNN